MSRGRRTAQQWHAAGVAATAGGRPVVGARLLRRALRLVGMKDPELRGRILLSLAYAVAERGQVADGLRLFDQAAALLRDRTVVDAQRGAFLARAGRLAEAIPHFDRAVAALTAAGDTVELSRALLNRAYARMNIGQLRQARADLHHCLRLARESGTHSVAVKAVQNLGYLDFFAGNVPMALRHFDDAARECGARLPSYLPMLAADRARVLVSVGLADEACRELAAAVDRLARQRLSHDRAETELALATAHLLAGRADLARRTAGLARRRFLARGNQGLAELAALIRLRAAFAAGRTPLSVGRRGLAVALRLAAVGLRDDARSATLLAVRAFLAAGRPAMAAEAAATVRPPRNGDPLDLRLSWHLTQAELAAAAGHRGRQLRQLRAGLTRLQRHRSTLGSIDLQTGIGVHGQELAAAGLAGAMTGGRRGRIFEWAELVRAQSFLISVPPVTDPELTFTLEELRHVRFTLREAELRGDPAGQLRTRGAELERAVRERTWRASGPGASGPIVTEAAVRGALAEDQAMVVHLRSGGRLAALVLTRRAIRVVELGPYQEADGRLRRLRADLDTLTAAVPERMVRVLLDARRADAAGLSALLLDPLRGSVGDRRLVIVPTGGLFAVPWAQLEPLRGRPVVVAPSATAWLAAAARPRPPAGAAVLVAGPGLRHAPHEVRAIAAVVPGATCLTGDAATPAATLGLLDGAPLAHLAAHGHHEPANALFSTVELATGPLMGYDLQRLRRAPHRVVLSACEVGLSAVRAGDEILGMVAALLAAGSGTVVASVARPIDDEVPDLMIPFHRMLAAGAAPAEALATAGADCRHPAFVCFGSG